MALNKLTYIESAHMDPYYNLAVEEYLLLHCEENECILYLWQNKNTVVIGRNQNAWKECLVSRLEEENGYLVRRLSGGGAVYHDTGNLNFTFLVRKSNYDLNKQLAVILKAVQKLGIPAEKSGRNDILADGRKFSGNAYYEQGDYCYHHGTLMLDVNVDDLSRYLTVSKEKLKSKGVDSVRARVGNLKDFAPDLTVELMKAKLVEAFEEVYGLNTEQIKTEELPQSEIEERTNRFASWDWIFGKKLDFQYEISHRFPWGEVVLQIQVKDGKIQEVLASSDAMNQELIQWMNRGLQGVRYCKNAICEAFSLYPSKDKEEEQMVQDMITWSESEDL